ncbi:MAG TPA: helix-turn-helix transcriptional regulator [Candidatus Deferrimicrobiaceae bacterium]|jgi:transcriptional regulator with XRE-family HTH domain
MRKYYLTLENNLLRKHRKARGLKQKEVARLLGIKNTSLISRWENGERFPRPIKLFQLAIVYRTITEALYLDTVRQLREEIMKKEESIKTNKLK